MDLVTQQKLERREHILESARDLIAGRGYEGLTMRELAAHCRVSVPTLYNQFGSKDALLAHAVQSHFSGLLAGAGEGESWSGHARLVGVVRACADEMVRLSRYHRSLLRAFMSARTTFPLQGTLAAGLTAELERAFDEMTARSQLASWANGAVLARQITAATISASVAWAVRAIDDASLRASMVHAAASMALGAARGAARTALEAEARRAQSVLVGPDAPRDRRTLEE